MCAKPLSPVPRWGRFEALFHSSIAYPNPFGDATLRVTFRAPSGDEQTVDGFWDGDDAWRVRFSPHEEGEWRYTTACSNQADTGLHEQTGFFEVQNASDSDATRWTRHGPVRLADDRRSLAHADGTPFLWLGDTAWNGPLLATQTEWDHYLQERARQGFSVVQWVATQWIAAPEGDREGQKAFSGNEHIAVNPAFFQRLDQYVEATERAGLLNIPVMLWSITRNDPEVMAINPGAGLPEDQAILLARYMVARWGANAVAWILPGDGDYRGEKAERWQRIGRGVFGDGPHAPVMLHPGGMHWPSDEFRNESWLDIIGYQSGHGDSEETWRWLVDGPPATDWRTDPPRPHINLEPPYEDHIAYQSKQRHTDFNVRRTLYWSLLNAPTAGVTYGGHGVWGWDDGSGPPTAHPNTGTPRPWQEALLLPAAEQLVHLRSFFTALPWWELRPAPELLTTQPGATDAGRHISVARTTNGSTVVAYTPIDPTITLTGDGLPSNSTARWFDPRQGSFTAATSEQTADGICFTTPGEGDWALLIESAA